MSHFTVLVIGENPDEQLAKYDENIVMDQYVSKTKEQIIERRKQWVEHYKNTTYAGYLANPEQYGKDTSEAHFNFVSVEFPKMLEFTDEELYQEYIKGYNEEDITPEGGTYSTYNPDSKWDWYVLGGRWSGMLRVKENAEAVLGSPGVFGREQLEENQCDQALKGDITNLDDLVTFAVVKDGEWFERGTMGWWGMVSDEKDPDEWATQMKFLLDSLPDDTQISIFDCHI